MLIVNRNFDFYDCSDSAMALGNPPMLCGKGSKDIKAEMEAGLPCNNKERLVKLCSKFFSVRNKISTDAFDGSFLCYRLYICMNYCLDLHVYQRYMQFLLINASTKLLSCLDTCVFIDSGLVLLYINFVPQH